jgi:hypothetical protein
MDLLHEPPPGFDGVAKAFAMAKHLPTTHQMGVKIGLVRDGVLFACGTLDGYRQVNFIADHLRELGWRESLLGGDVDMQGCDMLFAVPVEVAEREGDPSFIRRSPVELWPERGDYAEHADR